MSENVRNCYIETLHFRENIDLFESRIQILDGFEGFHKNLYRVPGKSGFVTKKNEVCFFNVTFQFFKISRIVRADILQ